MMRQAEPVTFGSQGEAHPTESLPTCPVPSAIIVVIHETAFPVFPMSHVTRILSAIEQGDGQAAEHLLPLVYDELRKLAAAKLANEKPGQTLQATALVHEAYRHTLLVN